MTSRKVLALTAIGLALTLTVVGRAEQKESDPVATLNVPQMTDDQIALAAENLRKEGPAGLDRAQSAYFGWQIRCSSTGALDQHVVQDSRWRRLIDLTSQQKDADVSRLFWYTDWDLARAEAERTGKPVLRLFMMGRLTDNLSCANSRFFRVALYGNERISEYLRENYVLCWTSVRPVPVITVDYGDGRKLERTVTGNSIHYIVNADGQLLDAMPGLVSPKSFETWLNEGLRKHGDLAALPAEARAERLRVDYERQLGSLLTSWSQSLNPIPGDRTPVLPSASTEVPATEPVTILPAPEHPTRWDAPAVAPTAIEAAPRAASKAFVELPLVAEVVNATDEPKGPPTVPGPTAVEAAPISAMKRKLEAPMVNSVVLNSLPANYGTTVEAPPALDAVPLAVGKGRIERPLVAEFSPPATERPVAPAPPVAPAADVAQASQSAPPNFAEALRALPITMSKTGVERPLVQTVVGREEIPRLIAETSEADWNRIAETFAEGSQLDGSSRNLMHRLHSDPEAPTESTCPSSTIESFERSIALDTARNMYLHRRTILEWILDDGLPTDLVAFNERVYGELFLTPSSDPWIGLVPQDVFTGIEGEGLFGN